MFQRSTALIVIVLLASMLLSTSAWSQATADKTRILTELVSSPARTTLKVKSSPAECSELALDLIVYRWAVNTNKTLPCDVKNIDEIIATLATELNDRVIDWAIAAYSVSQEGTIRTPLPPANDPRVADLTELSRQYGLAVDYRESSPVQSVNALTKVLSICRKLRMDITEAVIQSELGSQYFYDMARYRQAEECYGRAVLIFSAYDCQESAAMLYDDYGTLTTDMSRYPAATGNFTQSARQWAQLAKQYPNIYRYREMAGAEYIKAGEAQRAANDSDKALQLMEAGLEQIRAAASMTKSYSDLIRNLIEVASLYRDLGNPGKAIGLLQAARKACQLNDDPMLEAQVCEEFATTYTAANQPAKSTDEMTKRTKILEDTVGASTVALETLTNTSGLSRDAQAKLQLTAERGAKALQLLGNYAESGRAWQKIADVYKRSALVEQQIRCLRSVALMMDLQHKPQDSLNARFEAARLAMKANKKALAAEIVQDMAQAFIDIGDLDNALDALTDLAPIIEQSGNVRGAARVLEIRGTLLASHSRYEAAVKDFQDAQTRYSSQVGDPWAAGGVSLKLAEALDALGKSSEALTTLEAGLKDIERRYSEDNMDPNTNQERGRVMMGYYKDLTVSYVRAGAKDSASNLLLQAKRYTWTSELLSQLKSSTAPGVADFVAGIDMVGGNPGTNPISDTPTKPLLLASNWAEFSSKCRMLHEQHQMRYNALPVSPLEVYKARNELPRKALIIEYMTTGATTYVFVCGNGKSTIWELGISNKELDKLASNFRKVMKSCEDSLSAGVPIPRINDWREPAFLEVREPLSALYTKLVAPIADDLASYQMLMFALPDELAGIPMHALITTGPNETPRFLIQDYEVGYLGEDMLGDLIDKDSRGIDPSSDRLAIFADPAGNLAGARDEANMLEKLYFTSVSYMGQRATVSSFVKECDKASILHIAAHYKVDPNPSKFVLKLAPDGDSDGEITIQDLTAITNPHLQLVVLSACESAASTDPIASGPSCAAEVFSLAGAKSVLGGLWKVSDVSASKLMGDFYRTLSRGKTRTGSLRSAQVKMIEEKEFAHPFYWACFALFGNPW